MKATDEFKKTIQNHLEQRAQTDTLFAAKFNNEKKNIDECITYIFTTVQKSGKNGFTDDEVYNMAIHYYDEDDIKVGKPINAKVVVNHHVESTTKTQNTTEHPRVSAAVKKPSKILIPQPSLFD